MEKIDLQEFRALKQEIINLSTEANEDNYNYIMGKFKEIIKVLEEHDLSDIDFEEWEGMRLPIQSDAPIDFSKTKANLDFNIIEHVICDADAANFKGCKIKNFDFINDEYIPEMFDEEYIRENQEYFLDEDTPEDIKKKYYEKKLTFQEYSNNLQYFEGKKIEPTIGGMDYAWLNNRNYEYSWLDLYGEDLYKLIKEYKPITDKLFEMRAQFEVPEEHLSDEQKREVFGSVIKNNLNNYVARSVQELNLLMEFITVDELPVKKEIRNFIKKYGINNIVALDEETNGIFSHQLRSDSMYIEMIAEIDKTYDSAEKLTYDEFKHRIFEILSSARDKKGVLRDEKFPNYDFVQGKFREEHPEIFIDGNISEDLKNKFYFGRMKAEDIRLNPELQTLLLGKDLEKVFRQEIMDGYELVQKDSEGNIIGGIPHYANEAEILSDKIGQEKLLQIYRDYGKCLDSINYSIIEKKTEKDIRATIETIIYNKIIEKKIEYFEDLPGSFKEAHPELFLPESIPLEIRSKSYDGKLTFEDIRKYPDLIELLLSQNLVDIAFNKKIIEADNDKSSLTRSKRNIKNEKSIWQKLSNNKILAFAKEYGKYLENLDADLFVENFNDEARESLENAIEQNILDRKIGFDDTAPEFFKQKHPELFLDKNAPEELKKYYYQWFVEKIHTIDYEVELKGKKDCITFDLIKEHPEWKQFLANKDLSRAFQLRYNQLFTEFGSNTVLELGTKNTETVERMVNEHKEDILSLWYKSTGGKFVPHPVVMLNFPPNEIDSFLANSKRWSVLMQIGKYNLDDDRKTAMLKAAYSMGVFQGNDDAFNKIVELFMGLPKDLSEDEYNQVIEALGYYITDNPEDSVFDSTFVYTDDKDALKQSREKREKFKQAYGISDNGRYVLKFNKQQNKQKTKEIRDILERSGIARVITPQKAHQIFDSFTMEYNPDFAKFFNENIEEILTNSEYTKDIASIQRQFKDIVITNAGRRLTLDVARDYIKSVIYTDVHIGNEGVAEQAKIAGYSQKDFEAIQKLYDEGEMREFSSIPRIQGSIDGYTYEILRCDDPLALTIGTLTDCCQEIHGVGQTSMEHSVVSPDGRVFCVKDAQDRLVAQSWFWRNQYTGCFDNIEIPDRIFKIYELEHPEIGTKGLTREVLAVYKKAAQDLMQEDKRVYQESLENGTITQEQYEALCLGKITIGLGYNDIADAIQKDTIIEKDADVVKVKRTDRLPDPYTDAYTQYIIANREGVKKSNYDNLYVHEDDIPVYDKENMTVTILNTIKRMEQVNERDNLSNLNIDIDSTSKTWSERVIESIADEYGLDPNNTKVMATARMAIIYSQEEGKIKVGNLFSAPLKSNLTEEQKQRAEEHIKYQIKKALKQARN